MLEALMPNATIEATHQIPSFHDRIGPILDSAYLKHIPQEVLQEITLIRANAVLATLKVAQRSPHF
jgi:hypothetical protein